MAKCKKCGRRIGENETYCIACKEILNHKRKFWAKIASGVVVVIGGIVYAVTRGKVKINK